MLTTPPLMDARIRPRSFTLNREHRQPLGALYRWTLMWLRKSGVRAPVRLEARTIDDKRVITFIYAEDL